MIIDMEACSSDRDVKENMRFSDDDESTVSENIPKCYDDEETKGESTVEENLKSVHDVVDERIDLKKSSEGSESGTEDKCLVEDIENTAAEKTLSKKFLDFVDSDSEEEIIFNRKKKPSNDMSHNRFYNADDEDYSEHLQNKNNRNNRVIDSETEEDTPKSNVALPKTFHRTVHTTTNDYHTLIDSESEDSETKENMPESNIDLPKTIHKTIYMTTNYQTLIDSESEEEREETAVKSRASFDAVAPKSKGIKKKPDAKRKGTIRASKDEAMHQIYSQSQRLLRETNISLPYHQPRQRTLQEFLDRKRIIDLPKAPSIAAKLKMSSLIVSQMVAEKEKEAERFYTFSDSEDDTQQSTAFAKKLLKKSTKNKICSTDANIYSKHKHTDNRNFPKIEISDPNLHNKLEIQHLRSEASKLSFEKNICKVDEDRVSSLIKSNSDSNQDDESDMLPRETANKCSPLKLGVSRKLFQDNMDEVSDEQEIAKEIVESINSEEEYNDDNDGGIKEPVIDSIKFRADMKEVLETHYDSEVTDRNASHSNQTTESMKISETVSAVNNKEVTRRDNDVTDDAVASTSSGDRTMMQDGGNAARAKRAEADDASSHSLVKLIGDSLSEIQEYPAPKKCEKSISNILGLPPSKYLDESSAVSRRLLPELASSSKVTLKGSPGMIIDLNDAKSSRKGANTLLERFFSKHVVNPNKQADNNSEVTVTYLKDTQNGPLPVKEVLPYKLPVNTDDPELSKPGAKFKRLKEDLRSQMALKRIQEWKQKIEQEAQEKEKSFEEDEEDEEDYLDEEEEIDEFRLSDSGESEPEEDDVCIKDKKRSKCPFADDEAEVTDDDCEDSGSFRVTLDNLKRRIKNNDNKIIGLATYSKEDDEENSGADVKEEENSGTNIEESDVVYTDDSNDCANINVIRNVSVEGRIEKTERWLRELCQDDLNSADASSLENGDDKSRNTVGISKAAHCEDSINGIESNAFACQQQAPKSQVCKTPLTKTSMLDLVSPITQLSVLNVTLNSSKKVLTERSDYPVDERESVPAESPAEYASDVKNRAIFKKKLFDDAGETVFDDDYLMRLCSGKFESTQGTESDAKGLSSQSTVAELQLPRNFSVKQTNVEQSESPKVGSKIYQDVKLPLREDSSDSADRVPTVKEVSAPRTVLKVRVISSDDEDEADVFFKPKNRSARKWNLSDSEEEKSARLSEDESENDDAVNEEAEEFVDYDSEENEVIVPKKNIRKVAADFVEEEAELSESDWDSADEDEKGLDKLEFEEADDEDIDEHEVRDQLEKIHNKQMLDEDKRDVRMLKELLFEDGDLHTDGTGRERKFRWRNIDKIENNLEISKPLDENDGLVDVQEEEEEAQWTKFKHEREKFLEERMKSSSNEIEDDLRDSPIFSHGLEIYKKMQKKKEERQNASSDQTDPSENLEPIMPQSLRDLLNEPPTGKRSQAIYKAYKKRSLLNRTDDSLARIAALAKQSDFVSHAIKARNFVFQYVDPHIGSTFKKENKPKEENRDSKTKLQKRKITSDFSSATKRKRK